MAEGMTVMVGLTKTQADTIPELIQNIRRMEVVVFKMGELTIRTIKLIQRKILHKL